MNYPLLLTILLTCILDVSVRFLISGEFLTLSKPLKTLEIKFAHPIPIIARTITIIKNIIIMVLIISQNIYSKTIIKSNGICQLFLFILLLKGPNNQNTFF
jgi:hypothetical protein